MIAAGCAAWRRPLATASPPKRQSKRFRTTPAPGWCARQIPILRERLHDIDDLTNRLLRELVGTPLGGFRGRICRRMRSLSRATWAQPSCSTTIANSVRGLGLRGGRADEPRYHRGACPGDTRRRSGRRRHVAMRDRAMPSSPTATAAICICVRQVDVERAYAEKVKLSGPASGTVQKVAQPALGDDRTARISSFMLNAGLCRGSAPSRRIGRGGRYRSVPHRDSRSWSL